MIKISATITFIFSLLIALACFFTLGKESALSALFGGGLMVLNLMGLWFVWRLIFLKKSIALVVVIIIFKYLILGLILLNLNQLLWMRPKGFILGLGSLIFGVIGVAVYKKFSELKNRN